MVRKPLKRRKPLSCLSRKGSFSGKFVPHVAGSPYRRFWDGCGVTLFGKNRFNIKRLRPVQGV